MKSKDTPLACPHCGAGSDGKTLSLYWSLADSYWACVMCGFREYEFKKKERPISSPVKQNIFENSKGGVDCPISP